MQELRHNVFFRVIVDDDVNVWMVGCVQNDLLKRGLSGQPFTETIVSNDTGINIVVEELAQGLLRIGVNEQDFFALISQITRNVDNQNRLANAAFG